MALWTPYYSGDVLDLRKSVIVKSEPPQLSPHFTKTASQDNYTKNDSVFSTPAASPSSTTSSSTPSSSQYECYSTSVDVFRPFKLISAPLPDPEYAVYRDTMFEAVRIRNGGSLTVTNPRMRRSVRRSSAGVTDPGYQERRARNNAAAKRSRDLRKQKEDELAIRVAYLERQNAELRGKLASSPMQCARCNLIF